MPFIDRLIAGLEAFRGPPTATPTVDSMRTLSDAPESVSEVPSVDLVLDEMHRTMAAQQEHLKTLDTKASFYLTSVSIVVGFVGLTSSDNLLVGQGWLAVALVIYLTLLVAIMQAYKMRGYSSTGLSPDTLPEYLAETREYTKLQLIATLREGHDRNEQPIGVKVWWLRRAQWLFMVEVAYLVIVLVGHSQSDHVRPRWERLVDYLT